MASANTRNIVRLLYRNACAAQVHEHCRIIRATQCGVSFPGRTKVSFNAKMDLNGATLKPAATAKRQFCGLANFVHSKQARIELPGTLFFARRHRKLNMMDRGKRSVAQRGVGGTFPINRHLLHEKLNYFFFADGGTSPFRRRYIAAMP